MNSIGVTLDTSGIAELATAVEALSNSVLHANLDAFAHGDVVELMQRLETCKRQLSALDSRLIIEACDRSLPKGSAAKDVVPFLRQTLGLSRYDASVRVKIALQCGEFFEPTGHLPRLSAETTSSGPTAMAGLASRLLVDSTMIDPRAGSAPSPLNLHVDVGPGLCGWLEG
ncbi:hypothetical protein ACWDNI_32850 [Nocardia niigatensis]